MAKDMLTQHGIPFTDYNVASDLEKRQEMVTKSGQMGVPVISVTQAGATNEEIIIGFQEELLKSLVGIKEDTTPKM
jgi:glutaredoxin